MSELVESKDTLQGRVRDSPTLIDVSAGSSVNCGPSVCGGGYRFVNYIGQGQQFLYHRSQTYSPHLCTTNVISDTFLFTTNMVIGIFPCTNNVVTDIFSLTHAIKINMITDILCASTLYNQYGHMHIYSHVQRLRSETYSTSPMPYIQPIWSQTYSPRPGTTNMVTDIFALTHDSQCCSIPRLPQIIARYARVNSRLRYTQKRQLQVPIGQNLSLTGALPFDGRSGGPLWTASQGHVAPSRSLDRLFHRVCKEIRSKSWGWIRSNWDLLVLLVV